jgi:hypothetical protein
LVTLLLVFAVSLALLLGGEGEFEAYDEAVFGSEAILAGVVKASRAC